MPILYEPHEFHTIDIYGFQWEGNQPLDTIKAAFKPYGGVVVSWEPSPAEAWTKALVLSKEGALSWADAQSLARDMATPYPGAGSSPTTLWGWVVHSDKLYGYTPNLMAMIGIGGVGALGLIAGFLI